MFQVSIKKLNVKNRIMKRNLKSLFYNNNVNNLGIFQGVIRRCNFCEHNTHTILCIRILNENLKSFAENSFMFF